MPEIGVGFKLFADATALERGIVRAKKGMSDLDKETKLVAKTIGTIGNAIAASGIIQGFSLAINSAQTLRDKAKEGGYAIDSSTDAVARYGDAWDSIKTNATGFVVGIIGGINKLGEAIGQSIGRGISLGESYRRNNALRESEIGLARTLARVDEARVKFAKSQDEAIERQVKSRERLLKLIQEAGDLEDKNWVDNLNNAQKLRLFENIKSNSAALISDPKASAEQRAGARIALQNAQTELNKIATQGIDDKNTANDLRRQERREQKELAKDRVSAVDQVSSDRNALTDRSKLSLAELAAISPFASGVDSRLTDAGGKARDALDLEKQANEKRLAGDFAGSQDLLGKAGGIRESLVQSGALKSSDNDPAVALKKALKVSEDALVSLDKKIAGVAE